MAPPSALRGAMTALVTPFNADGSCDLGALDALVDAQLAAGIAGLVPCGSTGEAAALDRDERDRVIERVAARVAGRVPVIAGTGGRSTAATIAAQRRAAGCGASHALVVTPYYVRPSQEGLRRHYEAIAAACSLPYLAYNVPARSGCDLLPETAAQLAALPQCVGIKEATGELGRLGDLLQAAPRWALLSGDDASCCAFILMGGHGVVSVAANVMPGAMGQLVRAAAGGAAAAARGHHMALRPLFAALAAATNPVAIKEALALRGQGPAHLRLPLCSPEGAAQEALRATLRRALAAV